MFDNLIDLYSRHGNGFTLGGFNGPTGNLECRVNDKADVASVRELFCSKCYKKGPQYKSGWSGVCHVVKPPNGMSDADFVSGLVNGTINFQNSDDPPIPYDLANENCSCWANSLLEAAGVGTSERNTAGEFDGWDWGEEQLLPGDRFRCKKKLPLCPVPPSPSRSPSTPDGAKP